MGWSIPFFLFLGKAPPCEKCNQQKRWFLGHAQTEYTSQKRVILRAEGAILENAFLLGQAALIFFFYFCFPHFSFCTGADSCNFGESPNKMGAFKRPLSAARAQSSAIVHICGL